MAAASILTSGKVASSRTKFGGMAVPAAQLDLGRPFQEELSCPFDERRQIFVCEDGALVPEQISFKFHFRELVVGVDGVAESLIAIQSGLKFDCRHPAKVVMLGRVLRPASAVRPTGELAAFLVFRIGRHRQRLCFASRHADARRTSGPCYGSNPRLDSTPLFLGLSLSVLSPAVACCAPARCPLTITSYQGLGTPSVL